MNSIKPIAKLIDHLERLPGIGPKTAQRLAYYMLRFPQDRLESFGETIERLKKETKFCEICYNIDDQSPCKVCEDESRSIKTLCVVESPLDVLALEKSNGFDGKYHVLHGVINPLNNVGPSDLYLPQLLERLESEPVEELIMATNPSMEGEATAMYIVNKIREMQEEGKVGEIKITRIGRGLPTGADVEYADEVTLNRALEGRTEL